MWCRLMFNLTLSNPSLIFSDLALVLKGAAKSAETFLKPTVEETANDLERTILDSLKRLEALARRVWGIIIISALWRLHPNYSVWRG